MSSFVKITLDTTAPEIEIYIPSYTTNDLVNEITIQSNESLGDYQDIYVVDSNGERHDYTFEKYNDKLVGYVRFSNLPLGMTTIYAQVDDEVDNVSNNASKSFYIKEALTLLRLEIKDTVRLFNENDYERKCISKEAVRKHESNDKSNKKEINDSSREITIKERERVS